MKIGLAIRTLARSPGFAIIAILTLALGIGANTAIFSVVQSVVLAPLPFDQPDRLVWIRENSMALKREMSVSYPDFRDWQIRAGSFQKIAAVRYLGFDLTGPGTPEHVDGHQISAGFFSTLGVKPTLGREFSPQEDRHNGPPVVIISNRMWKNRFAGNPNVLGAPITLDGVGYSIIGILPSEFQLWISANDPDVYTPLGQGNPFFINDRTFHTVLCIARLRPGVTVAQASAEMSAMESGLRQIYPAADRGVEAEVVPLKQEIVGDTRQTLLLLLGAVGLVLLIACANVANLLLARSVARTREFAIRLALGAGRARIVFQLVSESVLLSLAGGVLGLVVAKWALSPALTSMASALPRGGRIGVNIPVLVFTFAISMVVGILFGLGPALKGANTDLQPALKEGTRGSAGGQHRAQGVLVVVQMALTLVLLTGASLLFRTVHNLWQVNPGFDTQRLITFKVGLSPAATRTGESMRATYQQLIDRIRQVPGVQSADLTTLVPLSQSSNAGPFWIGNVEPNYVSEAPRALYYETGVDYLRAMGLPLLRGRFFTPEDTTKSEPVIVIDSVLARTYFPNRNPVGQTITVGHWRPARIIGVVAHARHWGLGDRNLYTQNQIYISFYQLPDESVPLFRGDITVIVRTPLDTAAMVDAIKPVVYGVDSGQPIYNVRTMQEIVARSMTSERLIMTLLGAFAGLALLLATIGIYGVISYSMSRRAREIGIRMALGAEKKDVLRAVIKQGLRLAVTGVALGAMVAIILTRVLASFSHLLYGVRAEDPLTFLAVALVLIGAAVLASYIPARRAAKVDPIVALRYE